MWDKEDPEGWDYKVDMSEYITNSRMKEMKKYMSYLFADNNRKESNPWWQFVGAVEAFNNNRKETVLPSFRKVFDELMSAYRPRTTKTGNLPHLSNIKRKPEPLGREM